MQKSIVVLCCLFGVILADGNCFQPCGAGSNVACPDGSTCVTPSATERSVCVCNRGFQIVCSNDAVSPLHCVPLNNTGCGQRFPDGCPSETSCVTVTTSSGGIEIACRCIRPNAYLGGDGLCHPICPDNASPVQINATLFRCACNSGYTPQATTNGLVCAPSVSSTCASLGANACPSGYQCRDTSNGPECRPLDTVPHCGVDFRCPDNEHFACLDTANGPRCTCASGWSGIDCRRPSCWYVNGQLGCWWEGAHARCVSDPTTTDGAANPYCVCTDGYHGENCTDATDPTCPPDLEARCAALNNSVCFEGQCVCASGFISVGTSRENVVGGGCVPVNPPSCFNVSCNGNLVCITQDEATSDHRPRCECPTNVFGSSDCNHPRCTNDTDCQTSNSYCVYNTRSNVAGYCLCRPGFTGPNCEAEQTCNCTDGYVCTNDGLCRCPAGQYGELCQLANSSACVSFVIRISRNLTAEEVQKITVALIHVDNINVQVEGPLAGSQTEGLLFNVTLCGDANVDQNKSNSDFVNHVDSGDDGGLGVSAINPQSTTGVVGSSTTGAVGTSSSSGVSTGRTSSTGSAISAACHVAISFAIIQLSIIAVL